MKHMGRQERIDALLEELLERNISPQDRFEIAALLETMGWNDRRVAETFGVEGVFDLAEELWEMVQQKIVYAGFAKPEERTKLQLTMEMLRSFLRGLLFALPMAISVESMLVLKFSLWSYEYLSVDLATVIALGTILSFLVVGGFTQAIARRGFFYLFQGYYNMGRRITFYFIRIGYLVCALIGIVAYVINLVFNLLPYDLFLLLVLYFTFLTSIWLSVTVMYILRREMTFSGLIALGILIVYILFQWVGWDILVAQLISIVIVAICGMILAIYFFKQQEKKEEKGIAPKLPRLSIIVYSIMPYFTYGFLYFLFLYIDRIMAWSANSEFMPYFIWFRGEYELGLDFALIVLMLPLGVSEVVVNRIMLDLEASQKGYWGFETEKLNKHFLSLYHKWLGVTGISSLISGVLVIFVVFFLNDTYYAHSGKYLMSTPKTYFVFYVAVVSYLIMAMGLMNAVILFSISQPNLVNKAIVPAVFANVVLSFLLSRWGDFSWAVFGLLIGACLFSFLSYRQVRHLMKHLDYYVYAAS
ncbi:hypothetical protein [Tumebacillus permanentifrigoris]|uniref:Uncharacterized protein n=1 Tax=Tumebacillus permanentifrigoris TaxID=378543 RepID=A0A316DAX9_9BACL|nr:hypothetical protein [Tumebacillus permanentifrigoris]PWK14962.1 hypothetical protein C7459_104166 [Tumebacillus permanentifrigoris]